MITIIQECIKLISYVKTNAASEVFSNLRMKYNCGE